MLRQRHRIQRQFVSENDYTVIIPAFNAAATLGEAIASIRAQTDTAARIIVVDDGSTDRTAALARAAGIDVLVQERQGPGAACNRAIGEVRTPFLAFLDADDLWLPDKIEHQVAAFEREPALDGVFGRVRLFLHGQAVDPDGPERDGWGRTTLLIRTARARAIGPMYDPPAGGRGDMVDWIARGRELGLRFAMQPVVVALRRIIAGSFSYGRDDRDAGYLEVVRRAIRRKRARPAGMED